MQKKIQILLLLLMSSFVFAAHAQVIKKKPTPKKKIDQAFVFLKSNQKEKAYTIAHKLLKQPLDLPSKTASNVLLAHYFKAKRNIDSSLFYGNKALYYSRLIKNDSVKTRFKILVYNIFSINSKRKGLLRESVRESLKAIDLCEKYNETNLYYINLHGLAVTYKGLKDFGNSLKLFKECLTYNENKEVIYGSYINMGSIYAELEQFNLSEEYFKNAISFNEKEKNYYANAVVKLNLGANKQEQNKNNEAIDLYKEVIELAKKHGYKELVIDAGYNIGTIYSNLKKYKEAELIYTASLNDAIELGYLKQQKIIYDDLKKNFLATNDYKKAFLFASKSFKINDSINKLQNDKEIDELEVKYKSYQKEKEIRLLQIENSNKKLEIKNKNESIKYLELQQEIEKTLNKNKVLSLQNASEKEQNEIVLLKKDQEIQETKLIKEKWVKMTILYSFFIVLIPVIGLLFIYYQKLQAQNELYKTQKEINTQKISTLLKDHQLKVIKASVKGTDKERKRIAQELHDSIGGNLAAIKIKINNSLEKYVKNDVLGPINNQIDYTYEQVRDLSHNLNSKQFSENSFCDVLEEYTNSIWGSSSSFIVYPKNEVNKLNESLQIEIFKIIQELTTNTIKHAKATSIELQINLIENVLNILFEDNGVGFVSENNIGGIGFRNIRNRLKNFKGTFNIDSRINRGTIINIEIPIVNTA